MATSTSDGGGALIVGAGPVGLALACDLYRHGVPCRIIDQNEGPTPLRESRALGIHARTLEVLKDLGVVDRFLKAGRRLYGLSAYADGRKVFHLSLDLEGTETAYPFVLALPQSETERLLIEHLEGYGGTVERRTRLIGLSQDERGVTAILAGPAGVEEAVPAAWLIGCDGARSEVRKALGLAFEGSEYEELFLLADLGVDWSLPDDEVAAILTPNGPLLTIPLPEPRRWRLVGTAEVLGTEDPEQIVPRFRTLVTDLVAPGATVEDPSWISAFRIHRRIVDRYREGHCFVAGDAAHIHSPAGGQGMNTGIQDAYNLAWKLGLVHAGAAPESLLDSYDAERRPVAQAVLKGTDRLTRIVTLRSEVAQHLRNALLSLLTEFDFFHQKAAQGLSELAVGYRHSPIVAEDRASLWQSLLPIGPGPGLRDYLDFGAAPHPGDRVPDVACAGERLSDVLKGTKHTLLVFDGAARAPGGSDRIAAVGDLVHDRHAARIRPYLVIHAPARPEELRWGGDVLLDPDGDLHRRFGAAAECLYLIRPDGYVGYRSQPVDAEKLRTYLGRLFLI
ncbi:MAG: FAD-dependent monooxygenase [Isosphaeraceae bacterium]|nr:FAD-dependent monooxygenase [Isosphaeraceae bacterium]